MPIPVIKRKYRRRKSVFRHNRCDIPLTPRRDSQVLCQKLMRVCVTLMEPDGIVNLLHSALCYGLISNYSCIELEFKSNSGS